MALEIRVLVVEDDPETRMLTEALLSGRKGVCLCALAKDGLEGLELVEQTRPDIVLLDLILPGMDGLDFLRALRRRSARPAVVVASQASEPTVIRLAFQLGASYYLIKPLNFDSLPDLFHSLCLEPRERAAADYLRGMGASGLGVEKKLDSLPGQLSGGQQQRVAIARALAAKPAILLADEPTGNLDSRTSQDVLGLMKVTGQKFAQTMVMITHNEEIAQLADRIVRIEDGRIVTR